MNPLDTTREEREELRRRSGIRYRRACAAAAQLREQALTASARTDRERLTRLADDAYFRARHAYLAGDAATTTRDLDAIRRGVRV